MLLDIEAETSSWLLAIAIAGVRLRRGSARCNRKRAQLRACVGGRPGAELGRTNQTALMPTPILGTASVNLLEMTVSKPPTQAEVQAIAEKVNELIIALPP